MAVDTPVLERRFQSYDLEPEEHNARIRENYARLINPGSKRDDLVANGLGYISAEAPARYAAPVQREERMATPYLVQNARADAAIFRADSAVNMKPAVNDGALGELDEEDEDLRPTATTIQYRTIGKNESRVKSVTDGRTRVFGKKEKLIIAVIAAVILALVTLVIVNSAVIANLDHQIAHVQSGLTTMKGALAGVNSDVEGVILQGIAAGITH